MGGKGIGGAAGSCDARSCRKCARACNPGMLHAGCLTSEFFNQLFCYGAPRASTTVPPSPLPPLPPLPGGPLPPCSPDTIMHTCLAGSWEPGGSTGCIMIHANLMRDGRVIGWGVSACAARCRQVLPPSTRPHRCPKCHQQKCLLIPVVPPTPQNTRLACNYGKEREARLCRRPSGRHRLQQAEHAPNCPLPRPPPCPPVDRH